MVVLKQKVQELTKWMVPVAVAVTVLSRQEDHLSSLSIMMHPRQVHQAILLIAVVVMKVI